MPLRLLHRVEQLLGRERLRGERRSELFPQRSYATARCTYPRRCHHNNGMRPCEYLVSSHRLQIEFINHDAVWVLRWMRRAHMGQLVEGARLLMELTRVGAGRSVLLVEGECGEVALQQGFMRPVASGAVLGAARQWRLQWRP
jgi:hypothetical protein